YLLPTASGFQLAMKSGNLAACGVEVLDHSTCPGNRRREWSRPGWSSGPALPFMGLVAGRKYLLAGETMRVDGFYYKFHMPNNERIRRNRLKGIPSNIVNEV